MSAAVEVKPAEDVKMEETTEKKEETTNLGDEEEEAKKLRAVRQGMARIATCKAQLLTERRALQWNSTSPTPTFRLTSMFCFLV